MDDCSMRRSNDSWKKERVKYVGVSKLITMATRTGQPSWFLPFFKSELSSSILISDEQARWLVWVVFAMNKRQDINEITNNNIIPRKGPETHQETFTKTSILHWTFNFLSWEAVIKKGDGGVRSGGRSPGERVTITLNWPCRGNLHHCKIFLHFGVILQLLCGTARMMMIEYHRSIIN